MGHGNEGYGPGLGWGKGQAQPKGQALSIQCQVMMWLTTVGSFALSGETRNLIFQMGHLLEIAQTLRFNETHPKGHWLETSAWTLDLAES